MPIRFRCTRCRRLLGIASRKAGSEIECPNCGIPQLVPSEDAAEATMAMDHFAADPTPVEDESSLVVYEDEPASIGGAEPPNGAADHPGPTARDSTTVPRRQHTNVSPETAPEGMILYPRRTLYVQAILYVILAVVTFASGYLIGRGNADYRMQVDRENAEREQVPIRGRLTYNPGTGRVDGDESAVIIALPADRLPDQPLSARRIRPQDPSSDNTNQSIRKISEFGGAYGRADPTGSFFLVVPDQGPYRLLIISRDTSRAPGTDVDEVDLAEIAPYFDRPEYLIGRRKYRWTTEEVDSGLNPIEVDFGRDGQD